MERIYHHYKKWECYKNGFYDTVSAKKKDEIKPMVVRFFNNEKKTREFMLIVIDEWVYSCEHFLSNPSTNKIAYLGQAACCIYCGSPSLATMYGWNFLDANTQRTANKIAEETLKKWRLKTRLTNTLSSGSQKDMGKGYQTKLLSN